MSARAGRLSRLSSGSDDQNDELPTPGVQQADNAAISVYGMPTSAPTRGRTADIASAEADGAREAANGPTPEATATANSNHAEADNADEAVDGVSAKAAATAASVLLQHAERNDDDDDDDNAPART